MKVKPSIRPRCDNCRIIRRKGVLRVICSVNRVIRCGRVDFGAIGED